MEHNVHETNEIYGRDKIYSRFTRDNLNYDKDQKLIDRIEHNGLAHQKKFYFWVIEGTELFTDKMVDILQNDFTLGKNHVKVVGVSRFDNQLHITFERKLCYRFGIHKLESGLVIELMRRRDLDRRQLELNSVKYK